MEGSVGETLAQGVLGIGQLLGEVARVGPRVGIAVGRIGVVVGGATLVRGGTVSTVLVVVVVVVEQ